MNKSILVSVIIPCYNEEKFIGSCLNSIIANDYPKNNLEILVIDGMSKDKTRKILKEYIQKYSFIRLLDNPKKFIPFGINIGIKEAKGEIIMRGDAHTTYGKDYILNCVKYLYEYNADSVGGIRKHIPSKGALFAEAITFSLSHPFGGGNAYYRYPSIIKKPKWVDTVPFFCCKKEIFKRVGLFNENIQRSEDMEFNLRLKRAGGKILLVPEIVSYYYPRSTLKDFFFHNFKDGIWAVYPLKFTRMPLRLRHYIPLIFVLSLLISLTAGLFWFWGKFFFFLILRSYFLLNLLFSLEISLRRGLKYFFILPFVFTARHFGYGLGSLWGLIKLIFSGEIEKAENISSPKKNIWIFNHYATKPDEPATREYDIGRELIKKGHKVTIFASSFSHYKLREKYLGIGEKWKTENYEGIDFVWIKTFPYKKNDWRRAINMLSYAWEVFFIGKKIKEKPDVIIGTCVHPFAVLSAYLVARLKKCTFIFEVTDVWPQTIIDTGFMSANNPLIFGMKILEKFLYKKAEKIITLLPYAGDYIAKLGVSKDKIIWIPNGVDFSRLKNLKPYKGDGPKFIFMYSGIHAKYASLDVILKAAKVLQEENENRPKFVLVGDGPEKSGLVKMAKDMNLHNVEFLDMVPKNRVYSILEKADVFISTIKDIPVLKFGISSNKLNDYLALGRPIIFAVAAKNNPVKEAGAGFTIPPENPEALVDAVKRIISLKPEEKIQMAKNGKEYAKKYLDIKVLAEKLEKLL
jgi:glycosyltransferase involved in cell wall biosynthesis